MVRPENQTKLNLEMQQYSLLSNQRYMHEIRAERDALELKIAQADQILIQELKEFKVILIGHF